MAQGQASKEALDDSPTFEPSALNASGETVEQLSCSSE